MVAAADDVEHETQMFLAQCERGQKPLVYVIDPRSADLPSQSSQRTHGGQRDKTRVKIEFRKPQAWLYRAGALGERIRAAAIDTNDTRAIAAAMNLLSQYQQARFSKK